jgi:hypothetical protein
MYSKTLFKSGALLATLVVASMSAHATPCDEVKSAIAAKIEKNGVTNYTLEAVSADQVGDRKVVGVCEAGAKKIVYSRGAAAKAQEKPQTQDK